MATPNPKQRPSFLGPAKEEKPVAKKQFKHLKMLDERPEKYEPLTSPWLHYDDDSKDQPDQGKSHYGTPFACG